MVLESVRDTHLVTHLARGEKHSGPKNSIRWQKRSGPKNSVRWQSSVKNATLGERAGDSNCLSPELSSEWGPWE